MEPTGWFAADIDGEITAIARWYVPHATAVEVISLNRREWVDTPILLELIEDPGWHPIDRELAEAWTTSL